MHGIDSLRQDHRLLHAKLEALKESVALHPADFHSLRCGCDSLSRLLDFHGQREAEILATYGPNLHLEEETLGCMSVAHQDRLRSWCILNRNLADEVPADSPDVVYKAFSALVEGLCDELHTQESELFPILEKLSKEQNEPVIVS